MKSDFPDWFRILVELRRDAGMSMADVARAIGVPHSTVKGWYYRRGGRSRPLYDHGVALMILYRQKVPKPNPNHLLNFPPPSIGSTLLTAETDQPH